MFLILTLNSVIQSEIMINIDKIETVFKQTKPNGEPTGKTLISFGVDSDYQGNYVVVGENYEKVKAAIQEYAR